MGILIRLILLIVGYCFGLIQTAFIIGKIKHIDIRNYGSGNSGTTNAMRVMGKKVGFITYFADALKATIPLIVFYFLATYVWKFEDSLVMVYMLYLGFGVIIGHNFPFYMNFKGGKGIAATSGLMLGLGVINPLFVIVGLLSFFIPLIITKYVSLSSICLCIGFLVQVVIYANIGTIPTEGHVVEIYILSAIIAIVAVLRHYSNIKRLLSGTERKIGQKKAEESVSNNYSENK